MELEIYNITNKLIKKVIVDNGTLANLMAKESWNTAMEHNMRGSFCKDKSKGLVDTHIVTVIISRAIGTMENNLESEHASL